MKRDYKNGQHDDVDYFVGREVEKTPAYDKDTLFVVGVKDPKEVVIDEFIGQSIPICLYEIAHQEVKNTNEVLTFYFIMFILFRIFDILKPYPVNYYDKNFKNGFGVVMDDVCAGLYVVAVLVLYMVFYS